MNSRERERERERDSPWRFDRGEAQRSAENPKEKMEKKNADEMLQENQGKALGFIVPQTLKN